MREARLGRALGPQTAAVSGVAVLLPAGDEVSGRRPSPVLAATSVRAWGRRLTRAGRDEGLAAHVVHYRYRGWNGSEAHLARDAAWAAGEAVRRYGDVPVCLIGVGMGGRAALRAGGHEAVNSVVAVAPWLPEEDMAAPPEPVKQLSGRRVLIVHGTDDGRCDPELSFRLAARAKKANRDVCRFEVHSDGHALRHFRDEVAALVEDFAMGALFGRPFSRPVTDALAAPPPLGLRMPLAVGFGKTLR
ncbi:alpha/beta hydrolase [Streptomyces daghestanicus]|uniref:Alpha/beta hydrolase n=1 Tax=Streptomyces daghestanicus TaxID=66885 RepID=A0ABQ3Q253_9ACTN|nr:alpha/beta hydrolase [Streptomyces griseoviridis]GGU22507.1 alpha/beta hydrolase [Streptomyces daghestanicus]GHI31326.1 alpha/beta hydrolase [Streptomyces daghestanicus]